MDKNKNNIIDFPKKKLSIFEFSVNVKGGLLTRLGVLPNLVRVVSLTWLTRLGWLVYNWLNRLKSG